MISKVAHLVTEYNIVSKNWMHQIKVSFYALHKIVVILSHFHYLLRRLFIVTLTILKKVCEVRINSWANFRGICNNVSILPFWYNVITFPYCYSLLTALDFWYCFISFLSPNSLSTLLCLDYVLSFFPLDVVLSFLILPVKYDLSVFLSHTH